MKSAFGVDHGYEEFEKFEVPGMGALGSKLASGTKKLGMGIGRGSAGLRRGVAANPSPIGAAKMKIGTAGGQVAGGLRKLGTGMAARPGLTGGIAAGGAAAGGAGVAGGIFGSRRRQ